MRFIEHDVALLLERSFDRIEELWDADPYNETKVFALTIKAYMNDHGLPSVEEGMRQFKAFKARQGQSLKELGLENPGLALASLQPNSPGQGGT